MSPPTLPPATTVTVGGLPGTGTSTLCKLLERELGLPYHYAGALFRAEAQRRGLSLAEFGALSQRDPSIDEALDDRQIGMLRKGGVILEGRLSGWLAARHKLPAFKVWVTCDDKERIRRIVRRDGGDERAQQEATERREASEADRYLRYYGADLNDLSRYDLVLDSTATAPEALAEAVREALARQVAKA
ncbi:MAG TPA: cytidylate kinase family protein [Candidatus Thermoplasmatota archaeon]|nr:cytidylate kinase family protein [Candidatus Thermoplasmatota archaeon]